MLTPNQIKHLLNDKSDEMEQNLIFKRQELSSAIIKKRPSRPFTSTQPIKQRIFSSKTRGESSFKKTLTNKFPDLKILEFNTTKNHKTNDVLNLIIKASPTKYDSNLLNKKLKKMNEIYEEKRKNYSEISRVDELYFKYNILYGSKSNELIRSYSPKMRPQSASFSNKVTYSSELDQPCFTDEEIKILFQSKCDDLNLNINTNLESKFFEYCRRKCVNRVVNFQEFNLGKKTAEVLANILTYNQNIAHLKLSKNNFKDDGAQILMKILKSSLNIISLELASNDLTHKGGEIIFEAMLDQNSIISIDLSSLEGTNRNRLTADGVKKLEKVLKTNMYLEFLKLGGNSIKNEGLKYILQGLNENTSLSYLDLSNNEINSSGISYFCEHLENSNLIELDLSFNNISDEGVQNLSKCINKISLNSLKKLNLERCKMSAEGLVVLFSVLQNNKKLEYLNLNKNNFSSDKLYYLRNYFYLVNLKEIKMSGCRLGDNGAATIADGLYLNCSVKNLDLSENKITDKGFEYFIDVPLKNNTLENLDVSKNMISDLSCKDFILNLEKSSIEKLNFFDNQLRNESGTSLIQSLRANRNIIKVNIKLNRIHTRIIEEIRRLIKINIDNSKMKYIPNLKKEIRQNFVEDTDFAETEKKIHEIFDNGKTLDEKLKDDLIKFANLKKIEEEKLKSKVDNMEAVNRSLKAHEDSLKKLINDQRILQNSFNSQTENINKEILKLQDILKDLEMTKKEIKFSQDLIRGNFEAELYELNYECKKSEERMNTAFMAMESVRKELKNKKNLLDKLKKEEEEEKNRIDTVGSSKNIKKISQTNVIERVGVIKRDSMATNNPNKKMSLLKIQNAVVEKAELNHMDEEKEAQNVEIQKEKKKKRPKSHNPIKKQPKRYKLKKPNI